MIIETVSLSCKSCGAKLDIANDLDHFACSYCGTEQMVLRNGGTVSLSPIVRILKQVKGGVDKTSSELAIRRLREEIFELEHSKKVLIKETSSSILSMRKAAKVLTIIGLITLFGGLKNASSGDEYSVIFTITGAICTPIGILFYVVSHKLSNESEVKKASLDKEIITKKYEIKRHQEIVKVPIA